MSARVTLKLMLDNVVFIGHALFSEAFVLYLVSLARCRHSKCELAKLLNEEESFREILEDKDSTIRQKDEIILRLKSDLNDKNR